MPGGKKSGTVVFEQPKNDPKLTLHYTGNLFSDNSKIDFIIRQQAEKYNPILCVKHSSTLKEI